MLKALAKNPNDRYETVEKFAVELEQAYEKWVEALLNAPELTEDVLCQEHVQDFLLNKIVKDSHWWKTSEQAKIAKLRKQAEKEARTDIANVLSTLAEKAVGKVEAALERADWVGVDNLLHLMEEAAPPSVNPNVWLLLLKNLSAKQQVREAIRGQWKIHSSLLAQWGKVYSSIDDKLMRLWLPTEWSDLWRFLALPLPEEWHDIAVENLLSTKPLASSLVQSIEREHHSLVKNYLGRSLRSAYGQSIAVRLFAELVGSSYVKKMDLLYTLLPFDISQKNRQDFAEKILTEAHLTAKEFVELLETYGSRFESYYRLPIVSSYAEQYLLAFNSNDLYRTSARCFWQCNPGPPTLEQPSKKVGQFLKNGLLCRCQSRPP